MASPPYLTVSLCEDVSYSVIVACLFPASCFTLCLFVSPSRILESIFDLSPSVLNLVLAISYLLAHPSTELSFYLLLFNFNCSLKYIFIVIECDLLSLAHVFRCFWGFVSSVCWFCWFSHMVPASLWVLWLVLWRASFLGPLGNSLSPGLMLSSFREGLRFFFSQ